MRVIIALTLCLLVSIFHHKVESSVINDGDNSRLPQLFHLDGYKRCLSQRDGLYCVGTFSLTPALEPHPIYEVIKKYSSNPFTYNRTLIHRGYCVSARCPSPERNATLRFERCAAARARPLALRTALHNLHYCRTHKDTRVVQPIDTPQRLFFYVVCVILCLNIIGTTYDVFMTGKKNKRLLSWSVASNWERLIKTDYDSKDCRLSPLKTLTGARVIVLALITFAHSAFLQAMVYLKNPHDMEATQAGSAGVLMSNGATVVQMMVMLSTFLCTYNLLLESNKKPMSFRVVPVNLLRRVIRVAPVHLLLVGFGASWWYHTGDGPLWAVVVGSQSEVCRRKFWAHALFINNLVEPEMTCYIQTWFLAVDMQMHVVALILTVLLSRCRNRALPILGALFLMTCALISISAYFKNLKPAVCLATPEFFRGMFRDPPFIGRFHYSPMANLPAALLGVCGAFLLEHMQDTNLKLRGAAKRAAYFYQLIFMPLLYSLWVMSGSYIREQTSPVVLALYIGVERLSFCLLCALQFIGVICVKAPTTRLYAWRGWNIFARMGLSIVMVHWCVNMAVRVPGEGMTYTSYYSVCMDALATWTISCLLAVPVTVLLEMPVQRFFDTFIR